MTDYKEEDISEGIRQNKHDVLEYVYKTYFPLIRWKLGDTNGFLTEEDVWDVFQDAIVLLYRRLTEEKTELPCTIKTFIYGVCKVLILKRFALFKSAETDSKIELNDLVDPDSENNVENIVQYLDNVNTDILESVIAKYFRKLKPECRKILKLFYKGATINEIADTLNLKSEAYTKLRKHRCMDHLKNLISKDKIFKQVEQNFKQNGKRF